MANQSLPELPLDDILHLAPAPNSPIAETTLSAEPIGVEAAIVPTARMQTQPDFPWERTLASAGWPEAAWSSVWRFGAWRLRSLFAARSTGASQRARIGDGSEQASRFADYAQSWNRPDTYGAVGRGWGARSRVVIPTDLRESFDPEQRSMLLVHELATQSAAIIGSA